MSDTRAQWLQKRRSYIGASDTAILAGFSKWSTPLEIYLDKIGQLPEKEMTMAQKMGLKMEPIIADLYMEATGNVLELCEEHQTHPDYPFIGANPDRRTVGSPASSTINVQLKKAAFRSDDWGEQGTDQIPTDYMIQVQHEMLVTGQTLTHLPVFFLQGQEFCYYVIERNAAIIEDIIMICSDFWRHVQDRVPPEPDFKHESTPDLIKRLYKLDESLTVEAPAADIPTLQLTIAAYKEAGKKAEAIKKEREGYKAQLLAAMKDAAALKVGELTLTRKTVHKDAYTVGAVDYVDFRVKEPKGKKE